MLVELGAAFELAEADDTVRVVILRAAGPAFSAGHDLGSADDIRERSPGPDQHPSYRCLDGCFKIHQLNHAHWGEVTGGKLSYGTVEYGLEDWRAAPQIRPAIKQRP